MLWGKTSAGETVLTLAQGFHHYFYIRKQDLPFTAGSMFAKLKELHWAKVNQVIEESHWRPIYKYHPNNEAFFKVVLSNHTHMFQLVKAIEQNCPEWELFETQIPYTDRFVCDLKHRGLAWISYDTKNICAHGNDSRCKHEHFVDYRDITFHEPGSGMWARYAPITIMAYDLEVCKRDLKTDIKKNRSFPDAMNPGDEIIMVSLVQRLVSSRDTSHRKIIIQDGSAAPCPESKVKEIGFRTDIFRETYPDCTVEVVPNEFELINRFRETVIQWDPDIITGYNITGFDDKYIWNRAKIHDVQSFRDLGRWGFLDNTDNTDNTSKKGKSFDSTFLSGTTRKYRLDVRETNLVSHPRKGISDDFEFIKMPGRINFDMLQYVSLLPKKMSSRSLGFVSMAELGETKDDVDHTMIPKLFHGTAEDRTRLAKYGYKDSILVLKLESKFFAVINFAEQSRVTNVFLEDLLYCGQQRKVFSLLLFRGHQRGFLVNYIPAQYDDNPKKKEKFKGGTVIEPKMPFCQGPVGVLDFNSLYPSIIMAFNLCFTTFIDSESIACNEDSIEIVRDEKNNIMGRFKKCKNPADKGLLPQIVDELISSRNEAKKYMKACKADEDKLRSHLIAELTEKGSYVEGMFDPIMEKVYNGQQEARKIICNSVYGFTGVDKGKLPLKNLAQSVTAIARDGLFKTVHLVETQLNREHGYPFDAQVIYGDTDSVFVYLKGLLQYCDNDRTKAIRYTMNNMPAMAKEITKNFPPTMNLAFEKVIWNMALLTMKRYCGLYFMSNPEKHDKIEMKGIQAVKRDSYNITKNAFHTLCQIFLFGNDLHESEQKASQYLRKLVDSLDRSDWRRPGTGIRFFDFINTQEYKKTATEYKDNVAAHVQLVERMKERDDPNLPALGDQVWQCPVTFPEQTKKTKMCEKLEHPLRAVMDQVPIDIEHIIEKGLRSPLEPFVALFLGEQKAKRLFDAAISSRKRQSDQIDTYYETRTANIKSGNTRTAAGVKRAKGLVAQSMTQFLKKPQITAQDRAPLEKELADIEDWNRSTWESTCVTCKGGDLVAVDQCRAASCPVQYDRIIARQERAALRKKLGLPL